MPQKKNPDVLELIRGKSARVIGAVQQLFVLLKGLPLAYNRDLQEDKIAIFDSIDTVKACLELAPAIVANAALNKERIAARINEGFLDATALMEYLIKRGVPMRTGHEIVGRVVAMCEEENCSINEFGLDELTQVSDFIDEGVYEVLGAKNAVVALTSYGSGGTARVKEQLQAWKQRLGIE